MTVRTPSRTYSETLEEIYAFADELRSGKWTGVTGRKIETVVNIGIGGSDLGPVMVYEALKPYADAGISARYISNIDPNDLAATPKGLDRRPPCSSSSPRPSPPWRP